MLQHISWLTKNLHQKLPFQNADHRRQFFHCHHPVFQAFKNQILFSTFGACPEGPITGYTTVLSSLFFLTCLQGYFHFYQTEHWNSLSSQFAFPAISSSKSLLFSTFMHKIACTASLHVVLVKTVLLGYIPRAANSKCFYTINCFPI